MFPLQARWPVGCQEKECVHLSEQDMPPSVSYSQFTQILPNFLARFGEPLASFLTVLSCFIQDEMEKKDITPLNLMSQGATELSNEDAPNWERILRGDPPDQPHHFTKERDEQMRGVLRDALKDILDSDNEIEEMRRLAEEHAWAEYPYDPNYLPPLLPPKPPFGENDDDDDDDDDDEWVLRPPGGGKREGAGNPLELTISGELLTILETMEAQGIVLPHYTSPQDLLNKLVLYQWSVSPVLSWRSIGASVIPVAPT